MMMHSHSRGRRHAWARAVLLATACSACSARPSAPDATMPLDASGPIPYAMVPDGASAAGSADFLFTHPSGALRDAGAWPPAWTADLYYYRYGEGPADRTVAGCRVNIFGAGPCVRSGQVSLVIGASSADLAPDMGG